MNKNAEILQQVLEKLKLRQPIPDEIKEFVLKTKPESLISTLKINAEYSIVYRQVLKIYYSFGKSGMGITIAQSKFILAVAALFLGVAISTGAAVSYNYLTSDIEEIREVIKTQENLPPLEQSVQEKLIMEKPEDTTEEEIKSKPDIKKLSVVTTKDGKTYTGSFRAIEKNVEVITSEGKIIIPSENIERISPYKGD